MPLVRRVLESRAGVVSLENPAVPITDATLAAFLAGGAVTTEAGVNVTESSAMNVIAVYRGVSLISGAVAGLPLKAFTYAEPRTEVSHPALDDLQSPAGAGMTPFERIETVMAHLLLWGNAYLSKARDNAGRVVKLTPVHPQRVRVEVHWLRGEPYKVFILDSKDLKTTDEIMHVPCISLDGVTGVSPVASVRQALGIATAAERTAAKLYGNGNLMSGILKTEQTLTADDAEALKSRWRQKMQGIENAFDVAVLDKGLEFTPVSMHPADAQFLESRKFQKSEIATWLGLPSWMLSDTERTTAWGTGMEQQFSAFLKLTLKPYLERIEQRVTREVLPRTLFAKFVLDDLLRGDSAARAAFYASGIVNGWMVPNEVRRAENLPPAPWGDRPYLPHNTAAGTDPAAPSGTSSQEGDSAQA